jgi:hypothetical protein
MGEILHLLYREIDKNKWDECITNSPDCQIYALSWYLDMVCPEWQALVVLNDDMYKAVMPLPVFKKYGFKYIRQPYDCMQLGIYSTSNFIEVKTINSFLNIIQSNFKFVLNYNFNVGNSKLPILESLSGFDTHVLDLSLGYQELYSGFTKYRKRRITKARNSGLSIVEKEDCKPLIEMVREHVYRKRNIHVLEDTFGQLENLIQTLRRKAKVKCYYTIDENGQNHNGAIFIFWKNKINFFYNASTKLGRKKNGMSLILDWVIRENSTRPVFLDFESPNDENFGIISFYESFGAKPLFIKVLKYDNLPKPFKFFRNVKKSLYRNFIPNAVK